MLTEINGNEIKLYGTIWAGDGPYVSREIESFARTQKGEVVVRLHTPGGSVMDGNLIYNSLLKLKNLHVMIDGLAASMGTVLMLSGKKLSMAENAFIMIHAPSGSAEGNKAAFSTAAQLLEDLESNMVKKYKSKTGLDDQTIQGWMTGDNWFNAEKALELGLIDEIIDSTLDQEALGFTADGEFNFKALTACFKQYDQPADPTVTQTNNNTNMGLELSAKALETLGVSSDAKEDSEKVSSGIIAMHERMVAMENQISADKKKRIKDLLDPAQAAGKFLASEREGYEKLAESQFEMCENVIAKLPARELASGRIKEQNNNSSFVAQDRNDWTFDKWRKEDPKGMLEMKANNPEAYEQLLAKK